MFKVFDQPLYGVIYSFDLFHVNFTTIFYM